MSQEVVFLITVVGVCKITSWFMDLIEKIDDCKRTPSR